MNLEMELAILTTYTAWPHRPGHVREGIWVLQCLFLFSYLRAWSASTPTNTRDFRDHQVAKIFELLLLYFSSIFLFSTMLDFETNLTEKFFFVRKFNSCTSAWVFENCLNWIFRSRLLIGRRSIEGAFELSTSCKDRKKLLLLKCSYVSVTQIGNVIYLSIVANISKTIKVVPSSSET